MNTVKTTPDTSVSEFVTRENMKASIAYLQILQDELVEFEAFSGSVDGHRLAFMKLMTLTLGSATDWKRADAVAKRLSISFSTIRRYAKRVSAPHTLLYPVITSCLKEILLEEVKQLETELGPLETAEKERANKLQDEWQAFVRRVCNPVPNTFLNCQVQYSPPSDVPTLTRLLFAYPCRGIYPMSTLFTPICSECDAHGKDFAHSHGRVFLESEDGLLLLPQIVRTQADLLQVLDDLCAENKNGGSFILDGASWFEACKEFLLANEIVGSLPSGEPESVKPRDLSQDNLCWVM